MAATIGIPIGINRNIWGLGSFMFLDWIQAWITPLPQSIFKLECQEFVIFFNEEENLSEFIKTISHG